MNRVFVLLLAVSCLALHVRGYGEPDSTGRPVWQDRANHVLVNAVRLNSAQYKATYMSGYSMDVSNILTSTYPAVAPLYLSPQLDDSSYNHSLDMATTNTFSHSSSDGTAPFTRIGYFYTCNGNQGENIAAGYASPLDTLNQWLCDSTGSACAADGSGSDGHRSNIMSKNYKVIGVGFASRQGSSYTNYWTQDFGGAPCAPAPTNAIYGGSHIFSGSNVKFLATFYSSSTSAPSSANVNVDGTAYALSWELGMNAGQGHFVATQAKGTACRNYYFEIVSGGVTFRYPETGFLVTYGEGSCTASFAVGSSASTSAPVTSTSAPSTSAPTTSTPTTSAPSTSAPSTSAPSTSAPTTSSPTTPTPTTTSAPWTSTSRRWGYSTTTTQPSGSTSAPNPTTTSAPNPTTTTTRSAGTTTTSAPSSGFVSDILSGHNAARTAVKLPGLSWNDSIATFATNYAKNCVFQHNSNRNGYGENIYASSGAVASTTGKDGTNSWVGEKANFNCASNTCASGKTCGHYTQVIWSGTNQLGCGAVTCTTNSPFGSSFPTWTFMVCDYNPPGNYVGQAPVPASSC